MRRRRHKRSIGPITYLVAAFGIVALLLMGCGQAPRISGPANEEQPQVSKFGDSVTPNYGEGTTGDGFVITGDTQNLGYGGFDVLDDNILNDYVGGADY